MLGTPPLPTAVPSPRRPPPEAQCTETALSTGERCARWARAGGPHCGTHARHRATQTALTASVAVVQMTAASWQEWNFRSRAWQAEAWRLYDITGQVRFVSNWVGNSVSRCRLYVAKVDDSGEPGEETKDSKLAQLASGPLGVGPAKDEALRLLGINLFVAGECYVVCEADAGEGGEDRWFVVSNRQIKRVGNDIIIRRSQLHGGGEMQYRDGVDLLLRVWTPHPADTDEPDSPVRSAIPDLREIEALRKREFAELDSRLAGAGMLPLPAGIDFPRGDKDPDGLPGFTSLLMRTMAKSLSDRASAEALVPIMFTVPGEYLDKIKPITFWSELSAQLLPLRESAVRSLAQSLDIPPEVLLGMGDANHWSAWQTSEDAITTQIVPVLSRIADALSTGYLRGAIEVLGREPDSHVYAFDTAPLTTRPNRAADALNYHGAGLISDDAAIESGAFREDQKPSPEERLRRLVEQAFESNPALVLADATLRNILGIAGEPTPPPAPPQPAMPEPANPAETPEPRGLPQPTPQTEASALVTVANVVMRRALSLAGGRLVPHTQRDRYAGSPRYQLHSRYGVVTRDRAEQVLRGAWDDLPDVAEDLHVDAGQLQALLHGFAVELLTRGMAYDVQLLRDLVEAAARGRRLDTMAGVGA